MSFYWLQPGWTAARCSCGAKIWPDGDPDWGACRGCFSLQQDERAQEAEYAEAAAAEYYRQMAAEHAAELAKEPAHDPR